MHFCGMAADLQHTLPLFWPCSDMSARSVLVLAIAKAQAHAIHYSGSATSGPVSSGPPSEAANYTAAVWSSWTCVARQPTSTYCPRLLSARGLECDWLTM